MNKPEFASIIVVERVVAGKLKNDRSSAGFIHEVPGGGLSCEVRAKRTPRLFMPDAAGVTTGNDNGNVNDLVGTRLAATSAVHTGLAILGARHRQTPAETSGRCTYDHFQAVPSAHTLRKEN